jgi:hypothetical protein
VDVKRKELERIAERAKCKIIGWDEATKGRPSSSFENSIEQKMIRCQQ